MPPKDKKDKGGLNVELHPLLRGMAAVPQASRPKRGLPAPRNIFDASALNPYLDQSSITKPAHRRPLSLNPRGKYVARGAELRAKAEEDARAAAKLREKEAKGLLPDVNTQEQLFKAPYPPLVEWWDRPYLPTRLYKEFYEKNASYTLDSEEAPVSVYIQHPVPVVPWEHTPEQAMYLTKKEMKRKRRNERQEKHREKQDRIKLGLDPPPAPKVKLSNLMNVLTNEAIQDPTGVEMKVRQEVQQRYDKHMQQNEERKLTPAQRHAKVEQQHERDLQKGYYAAVYKVSTLADGQHFFKVDMNAKQLGLFGVVLVNPRFNLVIVEGGAKSIKFYRKLMMERIKWTELKAGADVAHNECKMVWEGQIKELSFKKWSPMYTKDDDEAYKVLNKFGHENYWREAYAL